MPGPSTGLQPESSDDLFIGEVQAGIEWDFALRCLPAKAFFRTAFEYQYWDGSSGMRPRVRSPGSATRRIYLPGHGTGLRPPD